MKCVLVSKNNSWSNWLFSDLARGSSVQWYRFDENMACNTGLAEQLELWGGTTALDWVFFFHWGWRVKPEIYELYDCVGLHTANLPHGKGGSPLQNQIAEGVVQSHVNALQIGAEMDGGDIYGSVPITLQGSLFEIWHAIAVVSSGLITKIVRERPLPQNQAKCTIVYRRRSENDNKVPFGAAEHVAEIYDHLRMLQASGYPLPFYEIGNFRLLFSRPSFDGQRILCDLTIEERNENIGTSGSSR